MRDDSAEPDLQRELAEANIHIPIIYGRCIHA
jgi:hypothetical protein